VVLEAWDPTVRTVAMPLLGTGSQGFAANEIAPALVSSAAELLELALRVDTVFFVEVQRTKAVALSEEIDKSLGRKHIVFGTGSLNNTIRALLATEIEQNIASCHDTYGNKILKKLKVQISPTLTMTQLQASCRELCEYLTFHRFAGGTKSSGQPKLYNSINELAEPEWIRQYLHVLRVAGNQGSHLGQNSNIEMAHEDFLLLLVVILRLLTYLRTNT
jgi:hypothetical protein